MKTIILAAAAAIGLSGCVGVGGYGSGISVGYGSGYGYNGYNRYGYNGYNRYGGYGYGGGNCIAYDRFGRAYYTCGYGNYYGANRYIYSPRTVVYYYPGYNYRRGYYYDRFGRRISSRTLYDRYHRRPLAGLISAEAAGPLKSSAAPPPARRAGREGARPAPA